MAGNGVSVRAGEAFSGRGAGGGTGGGVRVAPPAAARAAPSWSMSAMAMPTATEAPVGGMREPATQRSRAHSLADAMRDIDMDELWGATLLTGAGAAELGRGPAASRAMRDSIASVAASGPTLPEWPNVAPSRVQQAISKAAVALHESGRNGRADEHAAATSPALRPSQSRRRRGVPVDADVDPDATPPAAMGPAHLAVPGHDYLPGRYFDAKTAIAVDETASMSAASSDVGVLPEPTVRGSARAWVIDAIAAVDESIGDALRDADDRRDEPSTLLRLREDGSNWTSSGQEVSSSQRPRPTIEARRAVMRRRRAETANSNAEKSAALVGTNGAASTGKRRRVGRDARTEAAIASSGRHGVEATTAKLACGTSDVTDAAAAEADVWIARAMAARAACTDGGVTVEQMARLDKEILHGIHVRSIATMHMAEDRMPPPKRKRRPTALAPDYHEKQHTNMLAARGNAKPDFEDVFTFHSGKSVSAVTFSADGVLAAFGTSVGEVRVMAVDGWELLHVHDFEVEIASLSMGPAIDGMLVVTTYERRLTGSTKRVLLSTLCGMEPLSGEVVYSHDSPNMMHVATRFSLDYRSFYAVTSDCHVTQHNSRTGEEICVVADLPALPMSIDLSPDGRSIAVGMISGRVYKAAVNSDPRRPTMSSSPFGSPALVVAYSPKGDILAAGLGDGTVQVMSTDTMQTVMQLRCVSCRGCK
mmetsp:Transcript_2561/g.8766  ORF Transcript_2561/g.8766 Transcript_2561/m.8766 type:complete len:705 (-) Transcript_2561:1120-3234(-)